MLNPIETFNYAISENGEFFAGDHSITAISPAGSGIFSMEDDDDGEMAETEYPLSLGIRYQDSAQKYEPVLAMCE